VDGTACWPPLVAGRPTAERWVCVSAECKVSPLQLIHQTLSRHGGRPNKQANKSVAMWAGAPDNLLNR